MSLPRRGTVTLQRARVAFVLSYSGRQSAELRLASALYLLREYLIVSWPPSITGGERELSGYGELG